MTELNVPWAAWYGSKPLTLRFPGSWQVDTFRMQGGDDIGDAGIRKVLAEPIGAPPLREYAAGASTAAILVDDLSRPTPAFRLLPYVLEELAAAGLQDEGITIIGALAALPCSASRLRPVFCLSSCETRSSNSLLTWQACSG